MPLENSLPLKNWEAAERFIDDGDTIVTAMAASEPQLFFRNAQALLEKRQDLRIYCANPSQPYGIFTDESLYGRIELRPMFLTAAVRQNQALRHVRYVPQHLSAWASNLLQEGPVDTFWGSCTTPDPRGFVSIGPSVCYEYEVLRKARKVILEVNPNLPFTYGSTCVPLSKVTALLHSDQSLPTCTMRSFDEIDAKIAALVTDLVPNGATLQLGIGAIPNALAEALSCKKNLGIHTEMVNDAIWQLIQSGAVTGCHKTLWQDKVIAAFAYGSEALYKFLDKNPFVEFHSASLVNDQFRIGRNFKMISINSAVEVDITGQVCSESIGHVELSGVGGATDTHVGAQRSQGGRGIIALKSQTTKGQSKIAFTLTPGAKVSISRNDVDTVVTEYGCAELKGKTVAERAKRLIAIAHPRHREELHFQARKFGYL